MLIRSQDKKVMVNLHSISQFYTLRGEVVADFDNASEEGFVTLRIYSDEEKAVKVLDLIQKTYADSLYYGYGFDNAAQVRRPYIFARNNVFQMPQDSEVEEQ